MRDRVRGPGEYRHNPTKQITRTEDLGMVQEQVTLRRADQEPFAWR